MTAISSAQRVYDAKSPKKSVTSPEFATPVHKRSTTAPQPIQRPSAPPPAKRVDEDAASEPDFVQDRVEFIADIRKKHQDQKNHNQSNKTSPVKSPQKGIADEKKLNGKIASNGRVSSLDHSLNFHITGKKVAFTNSFKVEH
ncbi:hypothetical protein COOONC_07163 [Cooperia oncophora]